MTDEPNLCERCGEPASPGGNADLCPPCEDLQRAAVVHDHPPADPTGHGRVPPHANRTR